MDFPLTPAVLYILLALAEEDRHGYAIMRDAADRSGGAIRLGPGTLYGTLKRLLNAGLVEEKGSDAHDARRRVYRLTASGRSTLGREIERLQTILKHPGASVALREASV